MLLALAFMAATGTPARAAAPRLAIQNHRLILCNGFVYLEFDAKHPAIDVVKADFFGQGHYGLNLLATNGPRAGIVLESVGPDGRLNVSSEARSRIAFKILRHDTNEVRVCIRGIRGGQARPTVTSDWTLSLSANSRKFTLESRTVVLHSRPVKAIAIGAYLNQWFMNGLFQRGVMQYVNCGDQSFFTTNELRAFYTMDRHQDSVAVVPNYFPQGTIWAMHSGDIGGGVGLETFLAGDCPADESWQKMDWKAAPNVTPPRGTAWETSVDIFPNDYPFPVFTIPVGDPMDFRDLRTFYTAIYGSAAGVLGSFVYDGSAYPTLATPKRPYGNLFTFFDPDSWSTVNTLSFSGDPYLQEQARRIIELSGSWMKDGQIPHHFIAGKPTYIAISKATQTGPNIFWVLAAIDYATATGDEAWLQAHYPQLRAATDWVLNGYDPARQLVKADGPLFIDVFIRQGYTLDSNAMLLRLLPEMSAVAQFCGDARSASRYSELTDAIKQGINAGLWNGRDHYVTQRNADGSLRDRVDYDGNYAAIAFGAATNRQQITAMYRRLDGGPHTHPGNRGTWTSEKYYGPEDCYGGNTGDSATAMARIWWLDLDSRYVTGDLTNFYRYFEPVRDDLLENTWLTERYNAQGKPIRAPYYHEYPEITTMVLREMVYGIDIKIGRVRVKPFGLDSYRYQIGNIAVSYNRRRVSLDIPGHNERTYEIHGLFPSAPYSIFIGLVQTVPAATTDRHGTLTFHAPVGQTITVQLERPAS